MTVLTPEIKPTVPLSAPSQGAMPYLGLPLAEFHFGGLPNYLRKYADDELRKMARHIANCEFDLMWAVNSLELELGLSPLEWTKGPSWWVLEVLPAIKAELGRRTRPRRAYTGNSPIARLKALDLGTVAGKYTELRRSGPGKLKGRCPLHEERTPSFYVYEDSQRWQCFGACAEGGDVVDLLARLSARRSTSG